MKAVRVVAASRATEVEFWRHTKLGLSLRKLAYDQRIRHAIIVNNAGPGAQGLGQVYNRFLTPRFAEETLLLVHDDVYIDDYFLAFRLNEALSRYDVVGVAGSKALEEPQLSWAFRYDSRDHKWRWQGRGKLSGAVAHFSPHGELVTCYGECPADCLLLDGCFLALNTEKVLAGEARFDERFAFHFYDLDFCRACVLAGLRLGTWPLAITHESDGAFDTPPWRQAMAQYLLKWYGSAELAGLP